jgi:hypothetical protein
VPIEQQLLKTCVACEKTRSNSEASVAKADTDEGDITTEDSETTRKVCQGLELSSKTLVNRFWTRLVLWGSSKSYENLDDIRAGRIFTYDDEIHTARKMGILAVSYCLFECGLFAFMGVGWNFYQTYTSASNMLYTYYTYRSLLIVKSTVDRVYFIRNEVRIVRFQKRPESQLIILQQSDQSLDTSADPSNSVRTTSPLPSRPASVTEQRSTAREGQAEFGPPGRIDTEADIGLVPLARRKTHPPALGGQDL